MDANFYGPTIRSMAFSLLFLLTLCVSICVADDLLILKVPPLLKKNLNLFGVRGVYIVS
jgi:hypothetical protein